MIQKNAGDSAFSEEDLTAVSPRIQENGFATAEIITPSTVNVVIEFEQAEEETDTVLCPVVAHSDFKKTLTAPENRTSERKRSK